MNHPIIRRGLSILLLTVILFVALSACTAPAEKGQDAGNKTEKVEPAQTEAEPTDAETDPTDAETEPTDSKAEEQGKGEGEAKLKGGTAIVGITQEPDFLDPHLAVAAGTKEILFNLFEGLVRLTPEGDFEPCLASEWKIEDEGKALRFQLREGVKFHNGKELTADDVVYSLNRAAGLDTDKPLIPGLAGITSVEAANDGKEILIKQDAPFPDLISYLTCAIIPADYEEQSEKPVGTGPFMFASYTPQVDLVMNRFEDYWGEDSAYLDSVIFRIYSNMDTAYLELKSGDIDVFPYLSMDKADSLKEEYNIVTGSANMVQIFALNNKREPLDNPEVRKAINLAVDRAKVIELTMGEYGVPLASGMASAMGAYFNDALGQELTTDVEEAKAVLKEAGFPDGIDFTLTVMSNYQIHVDTANILAAQLKEAGIRVKIETVDWGTWLERVYAGRDFDSTVVALTFDYTPSDVLHRYGSGSDDNFINFKSDAFDQLVEESSKETDHEKRVTLFREMQKILFEENASVFLQDPLNLTAVRKALDGYKQYPAYVQDLSLVYFTDNAEMEVSGNR